MIDYDKIARSVKFFEECGFERIEAPWWVSTETMEITAPKDCKPDVYYLKHNKKCLVASGEQGFLYIAAKGRLPRGKFQTVTPCFRDDSIGTLYRKCFIKNELIDTNNVTPKRLDQIINMAYNFFSTIVPTPMDLKIIEVPQEPVM